MIEITFTLDNYDADTESYKECKTRYKLDNENPSPYLTTDNCLDIINAGIELSFNVLDNDTEEILNEMHSTDEPKSIDDKIKQLSKEFFIRSTRLLTLCNNINYITANVCGERLDKLEKREIKHKYPIMLLCEEDDTSFRKCRSVVYPDSVQMYDIMLGTHKMYDDIIKYLIGCDYSTSDIKEIINDGIDKIKQQLNERLDSRSI